MKGSKFPVGWDEAKVRQILDVYENQTDDEAIAEDEAAFTDSSQIFMGIPKELAPIVRSMIAAYHSTKLASV